MNGIYLIFCKLFLKLYIFHIFRTNVPLSFALLGFCVQACEYERRFGRVDEDKRKTNHDLSVPIWK